MKVIVKSLARLIPGTKANIAYRKKSMEKILRLAGYTQAEALKITVRYFKARKMEKAE